MPSPHFSDRKGGGNKSKEQAMGGGSRPPTAAGVGASTLSMASENFGHSAARLRRVKKLQFGVTNPHELVRFPLVVRVGCGTISTREGGLEEEIWTVEHYCGKDDRRRRARARAEYCSILLVKGAN